jgi:hypothetical protein
MSPVLTGTLPVMPFHPAQLVGAVQSDGQRPRVAALACEPDGLVICLSLVGPANSVSSALAKLMDPNGRLFFEPADGVAWDEPRILRRETGVSYKELTMRLRGTLEAHGLALPLSAHLVDGLVHPPVIPQEEPPTGEPDPPHEAPTCIAETPALTLDPMTRLRAVLAKARPRYLFGNWAEEAPNRRAFLGAASCYGVHICRPSTWPWAPGPAGSIWSWLWPAARPTSSSRRARGPRGGCVIPRRVAPTTSSASCATAWTTSTTRSSTATT